MSWGIQEVWSEAFAAQEKRELSPRNYIYASELGHAPIEVWLKMRATPPTNPPNDRAKMKMEAGSVIEGIVKFVFMRAGILVAHQVEANSIVEGVGIHGRLDFIAGGKPNLEQGMEAVSFLNAIHPSLGRAGEAVIKYMVEKYPDGLPEQPFEIKSIATYGMDSMELSHKAIKNHRLQLEHYLFTKGYPTSELSYICRDDYRMIEHEILPTAENRAEYESAARELSKMKPWIVDDPMPPKAPLIAFDEESGKFTKNLDVEWSNYLTLLYDFKEPREYSEIYGRKATSWNGVLKRMRDGQSETPKNAVYKAEMREMGFDPDLLAPLYKPGATNEEEV